MNEFRQVVEGNLKKGEAHLKEIMKKENKSINLLRTCHLNLKKLEIQDFGVEDPNFEFPVEVKIGIKKNILICKKRILNFSFCSSPFHFQGITMQKGKRNDPKGNIRTKSLTINSLPFSTALDISFSFQYNHSFKPPYDLLNINLEYQTKKKKKLSKLGTVTINMSNLLQRPLENERMELTLEEKEESHKNTENKEGKEIKEGREAKEGKEGKEGKDEKENKKSKENKENKENKDENARQIKASMCLNMGSYPISSVQFNFNNQKQNNEQLSNFTPDTFYYPIPSQANQNIPEYESDSSDDEFEVDQNELPQISTSANLNEIIIPSKSTISQRIIQSKFYQIEQNKINKLSKKEKNNKTKPTDISPPLHNSSNNLINKINNNTSPNHPNSSTTFSPFPNLPNQRGDPNIENPLQRSSGNLPFIFEDEEEIRFEKNQDSSPNSEELPVLKKKSNLINQGNFFYFYLFLFYFISICILFLFFLFFFILLLFFFFFFYFITILFLFYFYFISILFLFYFYFFLK